jgi:hypothetical protein
MERKYLAFFVPVKAMSIVYRGISPLSCGIIFGKGV